MRMPTFFTLIAIGVANFTPTTGFAQSFERWDKPAKAPLGSLQPRSSDFSGKTPANQAEQRRLSKFDARQKKKNRKVDQDLNICRC